MCVCVCVCVQEGYWELTAALGDLVDFNVDLFANEFLKNQGIRSLGEDSRDQVLQGEPVLLGEKAPPPGGGAYSYLT